ncbi:SUKH-4 family immunity protein [Streptomyces sp. TRM S81-3]|uniref:SUKH-4 family immunity protein n=1 Tax=Streptomyces griseicoloratus TaxID=2752516 RepID=A0A926L5R0_9ACTN|nr:SUKH-4 family immunity protein [Streptomyces griseicoloratus]MBD0420603.1 SUKH-4 family immunity protein [Streptomyces griseicoloratus]
MVTFAQAQERAEEWINGDVPSYQHREVRVREFELGFVVWAEDRADGPRSDGGAQRLVIARDSGEATLWPALAVGEVIRRYEEEYGRPDAAPEPAPAPPARVDLNQTSFLLTPPEWLQEAADRMGVPDRRGEAQRGTGAGALPETQAGVPSAAAGASAGPSGSGAPGAPGSSGSGAAWPAAGSGGAGGSGAPGSPAGATPWAGTDTNADGGDDRSVPLPETVFAPPLSTGDDTPPPAAPDAKTTLMSGGSQLPPTALAPAIDDPNAPSVPSAPAAPPAPTGAGAPAPAAPGAASVPGAPPSAPAAPGTPPPGTASGPGTPPPAAPGTPPPGVPLPSAAGAPGTPARPLASNAGDIADAATSKAAPPPRRGGGATPPPPPGAPGTPGARPGSTPPPPAAPAAPGGSSGGYVPTQLVSSLGPEGPQGPGTPPPPSAPQPPAGPGTPPPSAPGTPPPGAPGGTPPGGVHHAATMLADPGRTGGAPQPPGPPGAPGAPGAPQPPAAPGAPGAPGAPPAPGTSGGGSGAVHHAQTVLASPPVGGPGTPPPPQAPGVPGPPVPPGAPGAPGAARPMPPGAMPPPGQPLPGQPPAYGYPQPPAGQPTVGPGYQAVLRYRAQDGSEQQLIRRSAPGTPHPEWQIFHELRAMNVPPDQVLELHTELESCELPGAYCARMIREQWPQARITSIAPYGADHASRQQGMQQLLAHQGELHQVADGPARPGPVRAPLPPVQPVPPVPPEAIGQELAAAFGPGVFRFEQAAVSRQGVPPVVAHTLVAAGLPMDMGPFFWAQAQPGRPVPTLAELAAERGVQPASDAGSYLVLGSDFGKAICVQYGTASIVAVPVEAGPGGAPVPPQFVNTGLPEFARCLALLGRMWRLRFGLNQEQAGRWTVDFQAQLASLDPAALGSPESWWSVLLEQMWDGLL